MQVRRAAGEVTTQIMAPIAGADIVQLERKGNKYTMRVAWDGEPLPARARSNSIWATRCTSASSSARTTRTKW